MTNITEGLTEAGMLQMWRAIPTARIRRGRTVKYFSMDSPDRNGKYGYGFLSMESGGTLFFRMSHLAGVEVSTELPEPRLLYVRQYHFHTPIEEPKVGDFVRYSRRLRPCGCEESEAQPWMYERDYLAAEQHLAELSN